MAGSVVKVRIPTEDELYRSYIPFFEYGGLFVPTRGNFSLKQEIFLLVKLVDEVEQIPIKGMVAWITPKSAQPGRPAGIGVAFDKEANPIKDMIETKYLAGRLGSRNRNYTM